MTRRIQVLDGIQKNIGTRYLVSRIVLEPEIRLTEESMRRISGIQDDLKPKIRYPEETKGMVSGTQDSKKAGYPVSRII